MVLVEMNVARVNPYRSGQGEPRSPSALGQVPTPSANGGHPIPWGRLEISLPGGRRSPGGDDFHWLEIIQARIT